MSDFFAALAARIVHRPGDRAAQAVRPRLPLTFETAPSDMSAGWGEQSEHLEATRSVTPAAPVQSAAAPLAPTPFAMTAAPAITPAPSVAAPDHAAGAVAPPIPRIAEPYPVAPPPANVVRPAMPDISPEGRVESPPAHEPPPARRTAAPETAAEIKSIVATSTTINQTMTTHPPPAPVAPASAHAARVATPQQPLPPPVAPRIAQSMPPRAVAPLPTPPPEPTIEISIGRVEVRAAAALAERRPAATASPVMSLEDYLQSRSRRPTR